MGLAVGHRHLPAGREPGPQSRRRASGRRFATWVLGGLGLFFVVGGIATLDGLDEGSLFIFAVGFGLLGGAVGVRRVSWARTARHLRLSVDPTEPRRGERVSVRLDSDQAPDEVEVGLVCSEIYDHMETIHTTSGRSRSRSTKVVDAHAEWVPAQALAGSQQFAFTVPPAAPYSYEGDCVSYAWRVSARQRVEMGRDRMRDEPLWVLP